MNVLVEYADFFREFRHEFHTTGALLPSSPFLARCLARPLRASRGPWRILEVGPGTGAVTRALARRMGPEDRLDCVEINDRFVRILQDHVRRDPAFQPHQDRINVIHATVEDLPGTDTYDLIVSGLPLNNFDPWQVRSVFATFRRLLRPDGVLTYFEYVLVRHLKTPFVDRRERRRLLRIGRLVGGLIRRHQVRSEPVLVNVPPAVVRQLVLKSAAPVPGRASEKTLASVRRARALAVSRRVSGEGLRVKPV